MENFNEDELPTLSIDEIEELYADIIETPTPLLISMSKGSGCVSKGSWMFN